MARTAKSATHVSQTHAPTEEHAQTLQIQLTNASARTAITGLSARTSIPVQQYPVAPMDDVFTRSLGSIRVSATRDIMDETAAALIRVHLIPARTAQHVSTNHPPTSLANVLPDIPERLAVRLIHALSLTAELEAVKNLATTDAYAAEDSLVVTVNTSTHATMSPA
jgi:hypothetical protein